MCDCNFCKDHKWLTEVLLPQVREEDKIRLEQFFEHTWNLEEEYSYKKSVLDGSWPDSVPLLEQYLHRAKAKQAQENKEETFIVEHADPIEEPL